MTKAFMMKQHWMSITIVVGFALVLFLVIQYDVLYEQESAQPHIMTPEEGKKRALPKSIRAATTSRNS